MHGQNYQECCIPPRSPGAFLQSVLDSCLCASVSTAGLPHLSSSLIRANDRWSLRVGGRQIASGAARLHRHVQMMQAVCVLLGVPEHLISHASLINKSVVSKEIHSHNGRKQQTNVSSNKSAIIPSIIIIEPPVVQIISGKHLSEPY